MIEHRLEKLIHGIYFAMGTLFIFTLTGSLYAAGTDWPGFKGDSKRTSSQDGQFLFPPLEFKQKISRESIKATNYSSPIFSNSGVRGLLTYGSFGGKIRSIDGFPLKAPPSSSEPNYSPDVWSAKTSGPIYSTPAYFDVGTAPQHERIFASSTDGYLHCYAISSGQEIWKSSIGGAGFSSPLIVMVAGIPVVYVASSSGTVSAFNAVTGAAVWPHPGKTGGAILAAPVFDDVNSRILVVSYDGRLRAFDASTGVVAWNVLVGGATMATPALSNGVCWSLSNSGTLFAINATDGTEAFDKFQSGKKAYSSPAVVRTSTKTRVLMSFGDRTVVYREYSDGLVSSGANIWSTSVGGAGSKGSHSSPSIANGVGYLGISTGSLVMLNLLNGSVLQQIQPDPAAPVEGNPVITKDTLYFASNNGDIYIYGMPVAKISVVGPRQIPQSSAGTNSIYQFVALDANGHAVPTFTESLNLNLMIGASVSVVSKSLNFEQGNATATLSYPSAGGSRIEVSTNDGTRNKIWDPLDIFVDGALTIPTPPTNFSYYNYMIVENHSTTEGKLNSTVQVSDGSGFFDAAARISHSPAKLRPDAGDIRVYDSLGNLVNHQVVTNPQHVNTIIRFKVPYLAPGERQVYVMAFGNPGTGFPTNYDSSSYLSSIYNFADAFEGSALDATKFSVTSGSSSVGAGKLGLNYPFSFDAHLQPLDSSYGVRYEFKVGGGMASDPLFNFGWGLKDPDPGAPASDFRFTTGSIGGGTNFFGYAYGTGFQVNDGTSERKYFVAKAAPGLILGGRDFGDATAVGVDFGVDTGGTGGPIANPFAQSCFPKIDGISNVNSLNAQFDWLVGWEIHQDHPTATLLKLSDPLPSGWTGGAVTNDPVIETAWDGFDFEDTLDLKLPNQVFVLSGLTNPVDVLVQTGKTYVLDATLNSIHVFDASQHGDLGTIPLAVTRVAAMAFDVYHNWIWVTDEGGSKAIAVDLSGTVKAEISQVDLPLIQPSGIAVDSKGQVYLADNGRHRIYSFDQNRNLKWATGAEGYEVGHFEDIQRLIFDEKRGLLYVSDAANYRVAVFDKSGYSMRQFPRSSQSQVDMQWPIGVGLDLHGDCVVVDADLGRLVVSNPNGDYIGATDPSTYQFLSPSAAIQAPDTSWWVADTGNHRVVHYFTAPTGAGGGDATASRVGGAVKAPTRRKFLPEGKDVIAVPNPSKDHVRIGVWLDDSARAKLTLVNLAGEVVKNLDLGELPAGETVVEMDLAKFASGIYFLVYQVEGQFGFRPKETFKMAIIK